MLHSRKKVYFIGAIYISDGLAKTQLLLYDSRMQVTGALVDFWVVQKSHSRFCGTRVKPRIHFFLQVP